MKLLLCILDGVGIREETKGNAVYKANMPNFKRLLNEYPNCLLEASGKPVGLPDGQMGNSEVGHTNIGAGRIVYQPLELINSQIENKEFFQNKNILNIINHTKEKKSKLHIMGLLSDGGIHSHINHLYALLEMCKKEGIEQVYLHLFLDGRDTLPTEGLKYLDQLNNKIKELKIGKICTISGRYYAMDRDNNYDRLKLAYNAIVNGTGEKYKTYKEAIEANLKRKKTDEFTIPCVIDEGKISSKDGVIIFNFRPDRLREIGASLTNPKFKGFRTKKLDIKLLTMMPVSDEVINTTAYDNNNLTDTFGEYISKKGLTQLRIAETEKYAHVTYFFDGGVEKKLKGAKRKLIPSPKVATYDLKPEMSAYKITTTLLKEMNKYDVIILNFANGDMVGHTGNMDATVKALEAVDKCLGKLIPKVQELGGTLIVTADHGNSDYMEDENGNPITSHSLSKVPFIVTKEDITLKDGKLADIAPTMLSLLNLPIPETMTGEILIDSKPKKKGNKLEKIFRILSIIFILCSVTYFGSRFGYFYYHEHHIPEYVEETILLKAGNNQDTCDENKCYKGMVEDNYVYFKGFMWRIVNYNDETVRLISNESLTSLKYRSVEKWLGEFKNKLNADDYIKEVNLLTLEEYKNTISVLDEEFEEMPLEEEKEEEINPTIEIDTEDAIPKDEEPGKEIMDEFKEVFVEANKTNTFIDTANYWWLKDNFVGRNGKTGGVNENYYGVKPVIEISSSTIIVDGEGTISHPYRLEKESPMIIGNINIGNYLIHSNQIWRVVDIDDFGVKVAAANLLDSHVYSNSKQLYNPSENGSLAHYLNNDFYNTLNPSGILEANFKINKYSEGNGYNYDEVVKTVTAHVGLLNIGDLFLNDQFNYALLTEADNNMTIKVNPYNLLFLDFKDSSRKVRPVIYLDKNIAIISGNGLANNPYKIEV